MKSFTSFLNLLIVKKKNYNVVLQGTRLDGLSGVTVAIEIRQQNHDQRIMMGASLKDHLSDELLKST